MTAGAARFDLNRVRLRHYRNIASCDVPLGPLTILVGPNGSGKSNFLDALRFMAQALTENLDNALRERGGVAEVRRRSAGHPTHFGVHVTFRTGELGGSYGFQIAAVKGGDYRVSHEECRVGSASFGSSVAFFRLRDGVLEESSEPVMPVATPDRLYLVAASGVEAFRPVFDGLSGINVYNLNPEAMRQLQKPDSGELLRRDGSNIASVLERMRRERPELKERVEQYLRVIVRGVSGANRQGLGAWELLEFRQRVAGARSPWTFPATSMSDGTLRALGVLVALFARTDGHFSPIGIEEPEAALHPAATGLLLDALRDATELRQVMATSHSPDLLDSPSLKFDELLAVRSVDGTARIGRLDAAGKRALSDELYTPGELLRVDQLHPFEPESKQQMELFA
jgi:predicted ATPase